MNSKWSIWKLGVMVVAVVIMSGCVSVEEQRRSMVNHCSKLGFKYNSPEFSNCISRLDRQIGISQKCAGSFRYGVPYSYDRCMSGSWR